MQYRLGMLRMTLIMATLLGCRDTPGPPKQRAQTGDVAFVGATVLPMDRDLALVDHTVVVRGNQIVIVAPSANVDTSAATVTDVRGKWLLPGLADMHVHTWTEGDFGVYLLNGVTTVRDMFGSPQHLKWRADIAGGKRAGPTLITSGPIVDGDPPLWPNSTVVTTAAAAREAVRAQKQAGYDFVKVYSSLSTEAYDAIVAEANAQGIPFAGHVPKAVGLDKVLASGQRSIEHLDGYLPFGGEPRVGADVVAATARAGIYNSATLVVMERMGRMDNPASLETTAGLSYVAPMVRQQWDPKRDLRLKHWTPEMFEKVRAKNVVLRKLVGDLAKSGAKLVLGTDTGNPFVVPGFAVHDELALLVAAGLTPWQALRAATATPAEMVGDKFGVIAVGARADLIVVARDPRGDVSAVAQPELVVVRGAASKRADLLAAAATKPAAAVDRFKALPAIEKEGTQLAAARYDISLNGALIGGERAVIAKLDDGSRVVRGDAVYEVPQPVTSSYRATRDGVRFADGLDVARKGKTVVATPRAGKPIQRDAAPDAVIAPQTIAEFVWYADALADLKVGATKTVTAVGVMVEDNVRLEPASYSFTRLADAGGRRTYALKGKAGELDVEGTFAVDADGAPHAVEAKVRWGTFATKRVE